VAITAASTAELLRTAGNGDAAAWAEIMHRYERVVWAKVRSFRLQDADAFDAVQMTWLRLAENGHRLRSPDRLGGWLATTASRECLRILRQPRHTTYGVETEAEILVDPSAIPEQRVVDEDTAQMLRRLVAELPPHVRTLLRALFSDDPTPYAELARATGIPIGSIGPTRVRVLQKLRRMLDERGLGRAV